MSKAQKAENLRSSTAFGGNIIVHTGQLS
jgi:drug/metabolite transporter (DMT)-like permease